MGVSLFDLNRPVSAREDTAIPRASPRFGVFDNAVGVANTRLLRVSQNDKLSYRLEKLGKLADFPSFL